MRDDLPDLVATEANPPEPSAEPRAGSEARSAARSEGSAKPAGSARPAARSDGGVEGRSEGGVEGRAEGHPARPARPARPEASAEGGSEVRLEDRSEVRPEMTFEEFPARSARQARAVALPRSAERLAGSEPPGAADGSAGSRASFEEPDGGFTGSRVRPEGLRVGSAGLQSRPATGSEATAKGRSGRDSETVRSKVESNSEVANSEVANSEVASSAGAGPTGQAGSGTTTSHAGTSSHGAAGWLGRVARAALIPMIALCCGVTVANIYLSQPLLTLIADGFGVSGARAGWVATVAQLGYGLGVLLFVPLGDVLRRRPLLLALIAGSTVALLLAASADGLPMLLVAVLLASAATVVSQLLIPLVSQLTPPEQRGRVITSVQLGLFAGIILSRVVGGVIGEHAGWRTAYLVAAVATAVVGLLTVLLLPKDRRPEPGSVSYPGLLGSLPGLLRNEPELRRATILQATVFGTFSMFWTTLVFLLTGPPYGFDAGTAGLFGLFGLVGAVGMPIAGRFIDRFGPLPVAGVGTFTVLLSAICFALGQAGLGFAIAAITLINVGVFVAMGANQTRVLTLRADVRNRLNTIFVVVAFVGSSVGAALAATLYGHFGWPGVAFTGIGTSALACVFWTYQARRRGYLPDRSDSGR